MTTLLSNSVNNLWRIRKDLNWTVYLSGSALGGGDHILLEPELRRDESFVFFHFFASGTD